jgi:hypothetical protein
VTRGAPILVALCVTGALVCGACGSADAATIGSIHITRARLTRELTAIEQNRAYVDRLQEEAGFALTDGDGRAVVPVVVAKVLTNEIRAAVDDRIAAERHFVPTEDERLNARIDAEGRVGGPAVFGAFPKWYRDELVSRSLVPMGLHRVLVSDITPAQYYAKAKAAYARACEWDIVVKTRDAARAARARIEGGESFQSVARDVSLDKGTGPDGGKLGCNEQNNLVPELDAPAFALPVGMVSQPIAEGDGSAQVFHLLLVTSRDTPPLSRIAGEIKGGLAALGASSLQYLVESRLPADRVHIAPDLGTWDANDLAVVPPVAGPATSPTPRARPLPRPARSAADVDANYQVGQQIFITDAGPRPRELVAIVQVPISFTNTTRRPVTLRFVAGGHQIGPIAPGGRATYTPQGTLSIAYSVVERPQMTGTIQVEWYFDPGEDPGAPQKMTADSPSPTPANVPAAP